MLFQVAEAALKLCWPLASSAGQTVRYINQDRPDLAKPVLDQKRNSMSYALTACAVFPLFRSASGGGMAILRCWLIMPYHRMGR